MGTASLVIGIITVCLAFVPFVNYTILLPAAIGLVLGIVEIKKAKKGNRPKSIGITATILNSVAILGVFLWTLAISIGISHITESFGRDSLEEKLQKGFKKKFQWYFKKEFPDGSSGEFFEGNPKGFSKEFQKRFKIESPREDHKKLLEDFHKNFFKDFPGDFRENIQKYFKRDFKNKPGQAPERLEKEEPEKEEPEKEEYEKKYKDVI